MGSKAQAKNPSAFKEMEEFNQLIVEFMGYIHSETVDIDYSECGGLYTRTKVYDLKPILVNRYPEDDQYYLNDAWHSDTAIFGELKYHSSMDSLIPVVEKIETLFDGGISVIIKDTRCFMEFNTQLGITSKYENFDLPEFYSGVCHTKIDSVYKTVIEFIKWYNEFVKQNPHIV